MCKEWSKLGLRDYLRYTVIGKIETPLTPGPSTTENGGVLQSPFTLRLRIPWVQVLTKDEWGVPSTVSEVQGRKNVTEKRRMELPVPMWLSPTSSTPLSPLIRGWKVKESNTFGTKKTWQKSRLRPWEFSVPILPPFSPTLVKDPWPRFWCPDLRRGGGRPPIVLDVGKLLFTKNVY